MTLENQSKGNLRQKSYGVFLAEFCSTSSIHGVRYFTERRRHWTERCWWIIAIVLSLWFCGSSIRDVWIKRHYSPVTMSVIERQSPISSIPFPTVTICPEIKTYKSKLDLTPIYNTSPDSWDLTEIELSRIKALNHICAYFWTNFNGSSEQFENSTVFDVIEDIAPYLNDTLCSCDWPHESDSCSDLFVPIITEEGLCFAFNALNSNEIYTEEIAPEMLMVADRRSVSDWSLEAGYKERVSWSSYPIHAYSAQKNAALDFSLRSYDEDVEFVCRTIVPGFNLYLHTPGNILKKTDPSIRVPFNEHLQVSIRAKMITTSNKLRIYSSLQRQCFFNSDRHLRFFRFYSQENCELECLTNYTLRECGCVKFSMPRNKSTKICGTAKIQCYKDAYENLFAEDLIDGLSDENARSFRENCNCLPACTTITYEPEVDRAKYEWLMALQRTFNWTFNDDSPFYLSSVTIFFQNHYVSSLKRIEQYTYTDFLAICGGLLGLCLGVSALSIIEVIYYFTLRLYWSFRRWKCANVIVPLKPKNISIDIPNV